MKNAVVVKSFPNGIALWLDHEMEFEKLLGEIAVKFRETEYFFKDAALAVSFTGRSLSFEEEIAVVNTITENSSLNITCIVGKEDEEDQMYVRALTEYRRSLEAEQTDGQFYRGTLKKGQILETESSIIVLGDVEPGASVIAAGNIIVLGKLHGKACAGGNGRPGHYIAALEMTPQKLKIGDFKYIAEEKKRPPFAGLKLQREQDFNEEQPKMACVEKDHIVLRPITNESLNSLV